MQSSAWREFAQTARANNNTAEKTKTEEMTHYTYDADSITPSVSLARSPRLCCFYLT